MLETIPGYPNYRLQKENGQEPKIVLSDHYRKLITRDQATAAEIVLRDRIRAGYFDDLLDRPVSQHTYEDLLARVLKLEVQVEQLLQNQKEVKDDS